MKLTDLGAWFIQYEARVETWTRVLGDPATWKYGDPTEEVTGPRQYKIPVDALAEAHGVVFRCPVCKSVSGHPIEVTFAGRGVTDDHGSRGSGGEPTRWAIVSGSGLDDLTLSPSINCDIPRKNGEPSACKFHGHIKNGEAS